MQFFHRRVAWLALREFGRAVADSDHTLALMDFSSLHAPERRMGRNARAISPVRAVSSDASGGACATLDHPGAEAAVAEIDAGIGAIRREMSIDPEVPSLEEELEDDELLVKLTEMKSAIAEQYDVKPPLRQRLAEAIAAEQYEFAAELRDQMRGQTRRTAEPRFPSSSLSADDLCWQTAARATRLTFDQRRAVFCNSFDNCSLAIVYKLSLLACGVKLLPPKR